MRDLIDKRISAVTDDLGASMKNRRATLRANSVLPAPANEIRLQSTARVQLHRSLHVQDIRQAASHALRTPGAEGGDEDRAERLLNLDASVTSHLDSIKHATVIKHAARIDAKLTKKIRAREEREEVDRRAKVDRERRLRRQREKEVLRRRKEMAESEAAEEAATDAVAAGLSPEDVMSIASNAANAARARVAREARLRRKRIKAEEEEEDRQHLASLPYYLRNIKEQPTAPLPALRLTRRSSGGSGDDGPVTGRSVASTAVSARAPLSHRTAISDSITLIPQSDSSQSDDSPRGVVLGGESSFGLKDYLRLVGGATAPPPPQPLADKPWLTNRNAQELPTGRRRGEESAPWAMKSAGRASAFPRTSLIPLGGRGRGRGRGMAPLSESTDSPAPLSKPPPAPIAKPRPFSPRAGRGRKRHVPLVRSSLGEIGESAVEEQPDVHVVSLSVSSLDAHSKQFTGSIDEGSARRPSTPPPPVGSVPIASARGRGGGALTNRSTHSMSSLLEDEEEKSEKSEDGNNEELLGGVTDGCHPKLRRSKSLPCEPVLSWLGEPVLKSMDAGWPRMADFDSNATTDLGRIGAATAAAAAYTQGGGWNLDQPSLGHIGQRKRGRGGYWGSRKGGRRTSHHRKEHALPQRRRSICGGTPLEEITSRSIHRIVLPLSYRRPTGGPDAYTIRTAFWALVKEGERVKARRKEEDRLKEDPIIKRRRAILAVLAREAIVERARLEHRKRKRLMNEIDVEKEQAQRVRQDMHQRQMALREGALSRDAAKTSVIRTGHVSSTRPSLVAAIGAAKVEEVKSADDQTGKEESKSSMKAPTFEIKEMSMGGDEMRRRRKSSMKAPTFEIKEMSMGGDEVRGRRKSSMKAPTFEIKEMSMGGDEVRGRRKSSMKAPTFGIPSGSEEDPPWLSKHRHRYLNKSQPQSAIDLPSDPTPIPSLPSPAVFDGQAVGLSGAHGSRGVLPRIRPLGARSETTRLGPQLPATVGEARHQLERQPLPLTVLEERRQAARGMRVILTEITKEGTPTTADSTSGLPLKPGDLDVGGASAHVGSLSRHDESSRAEAAVDMARQLEIAASKAAGESEETVMKEDEGVAPLPIEELKEDEEYSRPPDAASDYLLFLHSQAGDASFLADGFTPSSTPGRAVVPNTVPRPAPEAPSKWSQQFTKVESLVQPSKPLVRVKSTRSRPAAIGSVEEEVAEATAGVQLVMDSARSVAQEEEVAQVGEEEYWHSMAAGAYERGDGSTTATVARKMQSMLERVWDKLEMPLIEKLDMAVRYTQDPLARRLPEALALWDAAAEAVATRESLKTRLSAFIETNDTRRLFTGNSADRLQEEKERSRLRNQLERSENACRRARDALESSLGDVLTYQGKPVEID